jgi:hypothetical protein
MLRKSCTVSRSYKTAVYSHSIPMLSEELEIGRSGLLDVPMNVHWADGYESTVRAWLFPVSLSAYASWARGK